MAPRRLCYLPFGLPLEPHIFLVLSGTPYSDLIEPLETTCSLISRPQNVPVCSRLLLNIYIYIFFFFKKYFIFYSILFYSILFYSILFGCVGSSLLCTGGLSLVAASGGYSSLPCVGFLLRWLLLLRSTGCRHAGFSSCSTWAQLLQHMGPRAHGLQWLPCVSSVVVACGSRARRFQ